MNLIQKAKNSLIFFGMSDEAGDGLPFYRGYAYSDDPADEVFTSKEEIDEFYKQESHRVIAALIDAGLMTDPSHMFSH